MADIVLSSGIRSNLLALQNTKSQISTTQNRLATGLAVSSAIDDAVKYFQAKSLSDRASDLSSRKSAIDQGVSTVTSAANALTSVQNLLQQMKGILDSARSGTADQRKAYTSQLQSLASQIGKLVNDASYNGMNLINSTASTLTVYFSEKTSSKLVVQGVNMQVSKLFLSANGAALAVKASGSNLFSQLGFTSLKISSYAFSKASQLALFNSHADKAQSFLDKTIGNVQAQTANMGANVAILNVRLDFTKTYINTLQDGSSKLTVADLNTESANMVSLQTRQQLGVQALSMANQSDQAILTLFR